MTAPPLLVPGTACSHVEHCLAAIDAFNPALKAMITVLPDQARAEARRQDDAAAAGRYIGPLAGVSVTLKDVIHTAGIRTTNGSDIDRDFVPAEDAEVVRRLKEAGAIIVGKANLHEYAYGGTTQNPFHGSCRNPWDTHRIPGGSSGGSAAAVASGMCLVSLGTDTAGSGRLPGSLCGVSALRPTSGAIPNRGVTAVSAFFDTISPMGRRVVDVARVFRAISGFDPADPFSSDHAVATGCRAHDGRLDGLRVGLPTRHFFDGIDRGVTEVVQAAITELESLGARLVDIDIEDADRASPHFEKLFHSDCAFEHSDRVSAHGDRLGPDTLERLSTLGGAFSAVEYARAMHFMRVWQWHVRRTFMQVDVIAHPTTPTVAPTLADVTGTTTATRRLAIFLYPWSLAQVPVLSIPAGIAEHGMPCGLSLAAPWGKEDVLFRVGEAFQRVTSWHLEEPDIVRSL